jgi:4-hydroxy-4-methyl-2-oxoglutarate aldolase
MIEAPLQLAFGPEVETVSDCLVAAFARTQTSFVADALGGAGALDYRIKPLVGVAVLGVALTCDCGPSDNLALIAAVSQSRPGDVIVAATGGFTGAAVCGDLLLGVAKNRGVAGFVTDGLVRDLADLEALGLPVFALGVTPNSPGRRGPGTVARGIVCGGVPVASGDLVVGDRDGVVIVPRARIAETISRLARVREAEAELSARVRAGLTDLGPAVGAE